jgi:hypothetical protein
MRSNKDINSSCSVCKKNCCGGVGIDDLIILKFIVVGSEAS